MRYDIDIEEAKTLISKVAYQPSMETVPLEKCLGRTLATDIFAQRPLPPFDRVAMDGIAIRYSMPIDNKAFKIVGIQAAGQPPLQLHSIEEAIEVMTGAMMPIGADTVIRYEDIAIAEGEARILIDDIMQGQNIHKEGSDMPLGALLCSKGGVINPGTMSILAAEGLVDVPVYTQPRILIVGTGDELVPVDKTPQSYQIRMSNVYTVKAIIEKAGAKCDIIYLADDADTMYESLSEALEHYDAIVLSGAVSMGKFDYLPDVLQKCGVEGVFHKILQRPGKPMWFGVLNDQKPVFALPGNPMSTFMCTHLYVQEWLLHSLGHKAKACWARMGDDLHFAPLLALHLPCKLVYTDDGSIIVDIIKGNGSGDMTPMMACEGIVSFDRDKTFFKKGTIHKVLLM